MSIPSIGRRRFIAISAAGAGLAPLPIGRGVRAEGHLATWRGTVLGAAGSMQVHHQDRLIAERLLRRALQLVDRLEGIFSLYRSDSVLVDLNRRGAMAAPPPELVDLLHECQLYARLTQGAFDPSVQPLWTLYARHFSQPAARQDGPSEAAIRAAVEKVGCDDILASRDRIVFARRGMALTVNGIVQGYVTDRVVDLLRAEGIEHCLVDMGEARTVGAHPDGRPWQIGLADPDGHQALAGRLSIVDQAVATSGGYGFRFDADGRFNHLFDPRTGHCASRYRSVSVLMPTATAADALATAFNLMPAEQISTVLGALGSGCAYLTAADGRALRIEARAGGKP